MVVVLLWMSIFSLLMCVCVCVCITVMLYATNSLPQSKESETLWDAKEIQGAFYTTNAPTTTASSSSSFDFSLPDPMSEPPRHSHTHSHSHSVHHQSDQYELSTVDDFFAPPPPPLPVAQSKSSCAECTNLLKQLGENLDQLDKVQSENVILKENLHSLSNRTKMLFTFQDCDLYEQELLQSFQRVKERKVGSG